MTYLDLATPDGSHVEIAATGWHVRPGTAPPPVLFVRTDAIAPLPAPERGDATRADLARILGLSTADPRFRIAWGWLVAQALPDIARPFLYLVGSQGSGKTTRGLLLANVLEPQAALGGVLKRTERENNPVAKSSFILTADNMTKLTEDVSNWLCSLVTGLLLRER
ncbi:MAG: hypothetical protein QOE61_1700, partial [Micromonosporaceae bacterium]|nr:hypothetical protein [Micromonosporaceae bacterium]